jgi:regulator of sigma E protease
MIGLGSGVANKESTEIGELTEGYPAAISLKEGDIIKEVNGVKVETWTEFSEYLNNNIGLESFDITVERDGKIITETVPTVNISYRLGIANFDSVGYAGNGLKISMVYDDHYVVGKAGLVNGDVILGYYVNEEYVELESWKQIFDYLDQNPDLDKLKIKYQHEETIKEVETDVWTEKSISQIGANTSAATKLGVACSTRFSFFGGIVNGLILFWNSITAVFVTLGALFGNSQITINELSGPVGIFAVVKQYLSTDFFTFMSFVGMISANIGLVNLLPLPALDGGRIVFIGYELVTRKKVNKNVETFLINIVFWLVMLLFVYITFKDIIRLF